MIKCKNKKITYRYVEDISFYKLYCKTYHFWNIRVWSCQHFGLCPGSAIVPCSDKKSANIFGQKSIKVEFSPNRVVLGLCCRYKKFHISKFYKFLYLYTKTLGALWRHLFHFWPKIFAKKWISAFRVVLAFWCISTKMCKFKNMKLCIATIKP